MEMTKEEKKLAKFMGAKECKDGLGLSQKKRVKIKKPEEKKIVEIHIYIHQDSNLSGVYQTQRYDPSRPNYTCQVKI